jgi:hypothetical protein
VCDARPPWAHGTSSLSRCPAERGLRDARPSSRAARRSACDDPPLLAPQLHSPILVMLASRPHPDTVEPGREQLWRERRARSLLLQTHVSHPATHARPPMIVSVSASRMRTYPCPVPPPVPRDDWHHPTDTAPPVREAALPPVATRGPLTCRGGGPPEPLVDGRLRPCSRDARALPPCITRAAA